MIDLNNLNLGIPTKELRFNSAQTLPFATFTDEIETSGADTESQLIKNHSVVFDIYAERLNTETKETENKLIEILKNNQLEYDRLVAWIEEERMFQISYSFNYKTKEINKNG